MVEHFNQDSFGSGGFFVGINDNNVTLPDGTQVDNGINFRNTFHMNPMVDADLFVPCGGRPASVTGMNVNQLIRDGKPAYKYIVEGANLFNTQEARTALENAGAILFKDASTNKGGVSSSSLEVLAALSMTDEEFAEKMSVKEGEEPPAFYQAYVNEVQDRVEENARLEFDCLWKAKQESSDIHSHVLTDLLSTKINQVNIDVQGSKLWEDKNIQRKVLAAALPKTLTDEIGLDTVLDRLPDDYKKSLFGCFIASRYVYSHGMKGQEFAFFEFMQNWANPHEEKEP